MFSAYAPHSIKPHDERCNFYYDFGKLLNKCSVNGPTFLLGDFDAWIGQRRSGVERVLGMHCFGRESLHKVESPNRDLLMEFFTDFGLVVANTLFEAPGEH